VIMKRLNQLGIDRLNEFLDSLIGDASVPVPSWILEDPETSQKLPTRIEISKGTLDTRLDAARYLNDLLAGSGIPEIEKDIGLWAWLSLFFFDQLCPTDRSGQRKPGERARWIPATSNFRKYYRHLLAGPYRIFRAHRDDPERALALLCGPLHKPGEIAEQLAARQELVTNKAVVELVTTLYIDRATRKPRRGAASKGPGSARRLSDVLGQFDVSWDLYTMETFDLLAMMPEEFDRFRPTPTRQSPKTS
jgi:hypothetical protein